VSFRDSAFGRLTIAEDVVKAKESARRQVENEVRREERPPAELYSREDLEWAFAGHMEDVDELTELASTLRTRRLHDLRQRQQSDAVASLTEKILQEWDETEKRERRERATAEAKRRLEIA
jgi:hypothetical protein